MAFARHFQKNTWRVRLAASCCYYLHYSQSFPTTFQPFLVEMLGLATEVEDSFERNNSEKALKSIADNTYYTSAVCLQI